MVTVSLENVAATLDGRDCAVNNFLVTVDAKNMVSAKMEHAFALKDGMVVIVLYVSTEFFFFLLILS